MTSPGGGKLSLSACPGVGNRPPSDEKNWQIPGGMPGGGEMVTGRIEPCIKLTVHVFILVFSYLCNLP